jgi:hypothetical protein
MIEGQLIAADPIAELKLIQERIDLSDELAHIEARADTAPLEDAFVAIAKSYGDRQGISYDAWRQIGVAATVLERAGITRRG